jgi:hypothetical protein
MLFELKETKMDLKVVEIIILGKDCRITEMN